ncbi:MAG: START domain-containing protein [Pseudomonadales bacterium]
MAASLPAWSEDWVLSRHDVGRDIDVYTRSMPDDGWEFRAVTHVHSRMSALVELLGDAENMPIWLYRTPSVDVIEVVSDTESYAHMIHNLPWPFSDRDSVVHVVFSQNTDDDVVTIRADAAPDRLPEGKRYIRALHVESFWRFTPLEDGRTRVEFQGADSDRSTELLQRLRNYLGWIAPHQTLSAFQEALAAPDYQSAQLPFVREPRIWSLSSRDLKPVAQTNLPRSDR